MKAIRVDKTGGPEVLKLADVPTPTPDDTTVLIEVLMAGVNYIDTYHRAGLYPVSTPFTPGLEGVGRVVKDPRGLIAEGTKVAWSSAFGSYAEYVCVDRDRLVAVPQDIDDTTAASMLLQGTTAHMLAYSVFDASEGTTCLLTAGAGGVGLLLTQMASARGSRVISLVSSDQKEELAREAGAAEVLRYDDGIAERVRELTDGRGVDVVYDGVGAATFDASLKAVRNRGLVCLFGAASGPVDKIDPQILNEHGSIFLTRPSVGTYTADPNEFAMRSQFVVKAVMEKELSVRVSGVYALEDAARAHRDLQSRSTTGSMVLDVASTNR